MGENMREKQLTAGDAVIYQPEESQRFDAIVYKVNKTTVRIGVDKFGQEVMMTVPKSDVYELDDPLKTR